MKRMLGNFKKAKKKHQIKFQFSRIVKFNAYRVAANNIRRHPKAIQSGAEVCIRSIVVFVFLCVLFFFSKNKLNKNILFDIKKARAIDGVGAKIAKKIDEILRFFFEISGF